MKTAVEWLVDNLPERFKNAIINTCAEKIEQAKQMEKEQIMNDYIEGVNAHISYCNGKVFISKEEYYNQTYNQNK